jgi:predicted nucleic acid-binding protein
LIVVDASFLVNVLGDDLEDGQRARDRLRGQSLVAPELIDLEVANTFRKFCAVKRLSTQRASQALSDLCDMRMDRIPHRELIGRCWELRNNLSIYDASYVAVAELFDAVLLTVDSRLARASGARCQIEVFS